MSHAYILPGNRNKFAGLWGLALAKNVSDGDPQGLRNVRHLQERSFVLSSFVIADSRLSNTDHSCKLDLSEPSTLSALPDVTADLLREFFLLGRELLRRTGRSGWFSGRIVLKHREIVPRHGK